MKPNRRSGNVYRRFGSLVVMAPLIGSSMGIDGGPIFQIFATENLGLSPAAIGTALGFGAISVPIQIRAARNPIHRSRANLQIFLLLAAAQLAVLAFLIAAGPVRRWAYLALLVTIAAEISLSVLYAPSVQPLLTTSVTPEERQRLNSRVRAIAVVVAALGLLIFGYLSQYQRAAFLLVVGLIAVIVARVLGGIDPPESEPPSDSNQKPKSEITPPIRSAYLVFSLLALGAWPLFVIYVGEVLWPEASLGFVGAVQLLGPVAALTAWRPSEGAMASRARAGGAGVILAAGALALVDAPVTGWAGQTLVLGSVFLSGLSISWVRLSALELIHRATDEASAVRSFTLLDVVASTSLQLGLWAAGFLTLLSTRYSSWPIDPYRLYLLVFAFAGGLAILRLRDEEPARPEI